MLTVEPLATQRQTRGVTGVQAVVIARAARGGCCGRVRVCPTRRSGAGVVSIRMRCAAGALGSRWRGKIAKGRGRKLGLPAGTVEEVLRIIHRELPADGSTHWSTRTMAARVGIAKDAVAKIWADHNLKPWKVDTFKLSNDPRFEEKLVDVVWLVCESARAGGGVQLRRKDPMPRWTVPSRRCR